MNIITWRVTRISDDSSSVSNDSLILTFRRMPYTRIDLNEYKYNVLMFLFTESMLCNVYTRLFNYRVLCLSVRIATLGWSFQCPQTMGPGKVL